MLGFVEWADVPDGGHLGCLGGGGQLVQLGVFHSQDILSQRLLVVGWKAVSCATAVNYPVMIFNQRTGVMI